MDAPVSAEGRGYTWGDIARLTLKHKSRLIRANALAVGAALLSVPLPLLMPLLVDEVLLNQPGSIIPLLNRLLPADWQTPVAYILVLLALLLIMRLLSLGLGVWQMREFTIVAKEVIYRMRVELVNRLRRVSMLEYETLGSGQVVSHLVTDLDTLDQFIGPGISKFLIALLTIAGTAGVLLWMHWQLALLILLLNPLVIYLTLRLGRKVKELKGRENRAYARFQEILRETLEAIQQIRAGNREDYYLGRVRDSAREIRQHATDYAWKTDAATRLSFSVFVMGFELFRALSMFMVLFSDLSIGEMFAVFGYLWFMLNPMQEILTIQYAGHSADAALRRVNQLFDLRWEPRYPARSDPFAGQETASLRLESINFAYHSQDELILNNLSLELEAGEKVAVVGASGGGKTTLAQVLLGLYPVTSGRIYFNNHPLEQIGLERVRENVATVLQHPALFNDTLRMNLTLGRDLPESELWWALDVAQLKELARALDQGLDTLLGQRGVRFSGGERQRVAIARMLLARPKFIILDEATSALDVITEARLHRALRANLQGKTTLIIAHRLSAIRQADRVLVFDAGKIVEQGSHEALIHRDGLYARLYGRQTGGF